MHVVKIIICWLLLSYTPPPVKVPFIVFFHYEVYVDVLSLSVSL